MHEMVFGCTGAYCDAVTGGYPLGNGYRTYLPALMRFSAPDSWSPFGRGGINPYLYCGGDPINRADTSGHAFEIFEEFAYHLTEDTIKEVTREAASMAVDDDRAGERDADTPGEAGHRQRSVSMPGTGDTMAAGAAYLDPPTWKALMLLERGGYVHGSNIESLEGAARFRAIVASKRLQETSLFFPEGSMLRSGELYRLGDFPARTANKVSPPTAGSALSSEADFAAGVHGAYGTAGSIFPVVYGIRQAVAAFPVSNHHIALKSIHPGHIAARHARNAGAAQASRLLLDHGERRR